MALQSLMYSTIYETTIFICNIFSLQLSTQMLHQMPGYCQAASSSSQKVQACDFFLWHRCACTCRISITSLQALAVMRLSVKPRPPPPFTPFMSAFVKLHINRIEYHLSVRTRLPLSSSLCVETSCPVSSLWGPPCECCTSRHLEEQQQSAVQRRVRIGWVNNTNMMQLAAPCEVLPIPCWVQTKAFEGSVAAKVNYITNCPLMGWICNKTS